MANTNITVVREKAVIVVAPFVDPHVLGTDPPDELAVTLEVTIVELVAVTLPALVRSLRNAVVSTYERNVARAVFALVSLYVSKVKLTATLSPSALDPSRVTSLPPEHLSVPAYPHTLPAACAITSSKADFWAVLNDELLLPRRAIENAAELVVRVGAAVGWFAVEVVGDQVTQLLQSEQSEPTWQYVGSSHILSLAYWQEFTALGGGVGCKTVGAPLAPHETASRLPA